MDFYMRSSVSQSADDIRAIQIDLDMRSLFSFASWDRIKSCEKIFRHRASAQGERGHCMFHITVVSSALLGPCIVLWGTGRDKLFVEGT